MENIPEEIRKIIGNKNIIRNIYRIMCRYFGIRSVDFMLQSKGLLDYTNLFSHNDYEKNDKIILNIFNN